MGGGGKLFFGGGQNRSVRRGIEDSRRTGADGGGIAPQGARLYQAGGKAAAHAPPSPFRLLRRLRSQIRFQRTSHRVGWRGRPQSKRRLPSLARYVLSRIRGRFPEGSPGTQGSGKASERGLIDCETFGSLLRIPEGARRWTLQNPVPIRGRVYGEFESTKGLARLMGDQRRKVSNAQFPLCSAFPRIRRRLCMVSIGDSKFLTMYFRRTCSNTRVWLAM